MEYPHTAIPPERVPRAVQPQFQHLLDTYASETNKVVSTWRSFDDDLLGYRPHPKSSTVAEILRHQLLSERRFFGEFLGSPEPPAGRILPAAITIDGCADRLRDLALARLQFLATRAEDWWMESAPFFGDQRQRIWIFWRRVLHTCHHRTQLTVYLRLLDRPVLSTYGPTADVTWTGADPTHSVEAAERR